MMRFIYTGKAPNLEKMADNLLAAADKVSGHWILGPYFFIEARKTGCSVSCYLIVIIS